MSKGRTFSAEFKAKVALEAIRGERTISELCSEFKVHSTQISQWKKHALTELGASFSAQKPGRKKVAEDDTLEGLYAKIGRLEMGNDFLKKTVYRV